MDRALSNHDDHNDVRHDDDDDALRDDAHVRDVQSLEKFQLIQGNL